MRNPTEMMRAILTDEKAQEIIDYVSPKYGDSYVGLWMFQAIGAIMGEIYRVAEQMRYEANPATADLLLDLWEAHYGISTNSSLTKEQRRAIMIGKVQLRGPCNPKRLEDAVSGALGGVPVEITENISKNTFLVNIREVVPSINPAVAILEQRKPAHLIYQIRVATQTVSTADIKTAIAMTHSEKFNVEVLQ